MIICYVTVTVTVTVGCAHDKWMTTENRFIIFAHLPGSKMNRTQQFYQLAVPTS